MSQIGVYGFHRIGLVLVGAHFTGSAIVQGVVPRKGITVVLARLRSSIQAGLQRFAASFPDYIPAQDTVAVSVHHRQEVEFVFFCPTKVYSSSNSATFGRGGIGARGKLGG